MSDGSFEAEYGKLAFAPGSSGWIDATGEETGGWSYSCAATATGKSSAAGRI